MTTQEKNELELLGRFLDIPEDQLKDWQHREDYILPVWYKFRDLANEYHKSFNSKEYRASIAMDFSYHTLAIRKSFSSGTFTDLYEALVNAVQWYNSIKKEA